MQKPPPREYQAKGTEFLVEHKRGILHMDPGLGKTRVTLDALHELNAQRVLVIAGTNAQFVWMDEEIPKWQGYMEPFVVHIKGTAQKRKELYESLQSQTDFIAFTTMQSLQRDLKLAEKLKLDALIYDEAHKGKNRKTESYKVLKALARKVKIFVPLSGKIVSRGPADLWALLNCINPEKFPSFWNFVHKYCVVVQGTFGTEIGGPKNVNELREALNGYVYYKTKKDTDVAASLPEKTRQFLPVEMDDTQRKLYRSLVEELIAEHGGDLILARSSLAAITRVRQLLVCPKILFPDAPMGGAFQDLLSHLEEESHVVVYSPFITAFPYMRTELAFKGYHVSTFQGGMTREQISEEKAKFVKNRGIALMSISYAESISLETASYGYFLGPDMDQNVNYQAEDRIHRMTSKEPVFVYYYDYKDAPISDHMFAGILSMKAWRSQRTEEAMKLADLL
jgi:SNF2 family DNA or RNA helicase